MIGVRQRFFLIYSSVLTTGFAVMLLPGKVTNQITPPK
jgi:hypothetical protein